MTPRNYFSKAALVAAGAATASLIAPPTAEAILLTEMNGYELHMEVHTVGRLQALDHDADDKSAAGFDKEELSDAGLQHAIGNLGWRLFYEDYYEVFFDVTLASRVNADKVWGHQGYILLKQMPEDSLLPAANAILDHIDIKAGHFMVDFGNEIHRRSNNADVQRNPLIGNPVVSPHATEAGIEIIHQNERGFGAMVGTGSGVATENFSEGARFSYRGKVWADVPQIPVDVAASYYRANHGSGFQGFGGSNLFRTERLGGAYAGVWDDGNAPGHVLIGDGADLEAWQLDAGWNPDDRFELVGHFGRADDKNVLGAGDSEAWLYYGATGKVYLMPDAVYAAARYSAADAQRFAGDSSNDGRIDRFQIGGGAWVLDGLLLKLEYVYQTTSGFDHGTMSGVELSQDPEFQGLIAEFSFSF